MTSGITSPEPVFGGEVTGLFPTSWGQWSPQWPNFLQVKHWMGLPLGIPGVEEFIRDQLRLADHPPYFWRDLCPQKIRPSSLTYNPSRNVLFTQLQQTIAWKTPSHLALNTLSVRLLHLFCITHCNCYLHGFVQRGNPKLHLLTYDTSSPIYVSGDQLSFHFFMNVLPRHIQYQVFWHSLLHLSANSSTLIFFCMASCNLL